MDQLNSHEDISTADNHEPFESSPPVTEPSFTKEDINIPLPAISEDDARQAFLELAEKHCCYSSTPAKEMTIESIKAFNTHRYSLVTFTENRECAWKTKPYYGGEVDGPSNGPAPVPWDLEVNHPDWFVTRKDKMKVPHTSEVKVCQLCHGSGKLQCKACFGMGKKTCGRCAGSGQTIQGRCLSCHATGREMCTMCNTTGKVMCLSCMGQGKLITFLQMKVKWKIHPFVFVTDQDSTFPSKRFTKVSGRTIFSDEDTLVQPITTFFDPSINEASQNIIDEHAELSSHPFSKILRQSQTIEWLPLSKVNYTWRGKQGEYFIYGMENKAYCDNYPRKCCCAIM